MEDGQRDEVKSVALDGRVKAQTDVIKSRDDQILIWMDEHRKKQLRIEEIEELLKAPRGSNTRMTNLQTNAYSVTVPDCSNEDVVRKRFIVGQSRCRCEVRQRCSGR